MPSIVVDYVRLAESFPIHTWNEQHRLSIRSIRVPGQIAVNSQAHGTARLIADGPDLDTEWMLE
jgi:hypothetical protein